MRRLNDTMIILSAELSTESNIENQNRTNHLEKLLSETGYVYQPAQGCYKGDKERSFIVYVPNQLDNTLNIFREIAFNVFNQESILIVDPDRYSGLELSNGEYQALNGKFQHTSKEEALNSEAYTRVPSRNGSNYFIVK